APREHEPAPRRRPLAHPSRHGRHRRKARQPLPDDDEPPARRQHAQYEERPAEDRAPTSEPHDRPIAEHELDALALGEDQHEGGPADPDFLTGERLPAW